MRYVPLYITGILFLWAGSASAATYYVATTGNDSNCSIIQSSGSPARTITFALNCAGTFNTTQGAGKTVQVANGIYDEHLLNVIPSGTAGNPFVLKSANPRGATLRWTGGPGGIIELNLSGAINFSYITIDGFVIDGQNMSSPGQTGIVISVCAPISCGSTDQRPNVNHITVNNNEIKDVGGDAISAPGQYWTLTNNYMHHTARSDDTGHTHICYCEFAHSVIDHNIFEDTFGYQWHPNTNGEDNVVFDNTISNNIFRNNTAGSSHQWAILLSGRNQRFFNNIIYGNDMAMIVGHGAVPTSEVYIYNNTFVDNLTANTAYPSAIYVQYTEGNIFARNNIMVNNGSQVFNSAGDPLTASDHNLCDTSGIGCAVGTPIFVNRSGHDYHLTSSAINAVDQGSNLGFPYNIDFDGVSRPQGLAYDIGAYEYVSGGGGTVILGDINNDRIVNSLDWSLMSAKWLTNDTNADLNKDGAVNSLDWSIMSSNWLKTI